MNGKMLMDLVHSKFGPNYSLVKVEADQSDGLYVRILVTARAAHDGYLTRIEYDATGFETGPLFYVAHNLDGEWQADQITDKIEVYLAEAYAELIDFTPKGLPDPRDCAPEVEDDEPYTQDPEDVLEDLKSLQDDVREIQDTLTDLIEIVGGHRKAESVPADSHAWLQDIIDRIDPDAKIPYTSPGRDPWNPMPVMCMDGMQIRGENWVMVDEPEDQGFDWDGWFKTLTDLRDG